MTFEEAIEIIKEECGVENEDGFFTNERNLDAFFALYIIKNLQETYAPKIKMPQKIMLVFMEMKFNYQVDFEFFWKLMGDCVATDYLRENYKEEELMMAWLRPELIEVSDDR